MSLMDRIRQSNPLADGTKVQLQGAERTEEVRDFVNGSLISFRLRRFPS